jgi:hypothetical protein
MRFNNLPGSNMEQMRKLQLRAPQAQVQQSQPQRLGHPGLNMSIIMQTTKPRGCSSCGR